MKNRVPAAFSSNPSRNGLRRPQAKVSWQIVPAALRPVALQRALPGPTNGLSVGMPPLAVMRSTFPTSTLRSREALLAIPQPLSLA
jgi:hypothetical protein